MVKVGCYFCFVFSILPCYLSGWFIHKYNALKVHEYNAHVIVTNTPGLVNVFDAWKENKWELQNSKEDKKTVPSNVLSIQLNTYKKYNIVNQTASYNKTGLFVFFS